MPGDSPYLGPRQNMMLARRFRDWMRISHHWNGRLTAIVLLPADQQRGGDRLVLQTGLHGGGGRPELLQANRVRRRGGAQAEARAAAAPRARAGLLAPPLMSTGLAQQCAYCRLGSAALGRERCALASPCATKNSGVSPKHQQVERRCATGTIRCRRLLCGLVNWIAMPEIPCWPRLR